MTAANQRAPGPEPALPSDEVAIRALLQAAALPHEDFAPHLPNFLVERAGGAVLGVAGFERHARDALLRSLVVAPSRRGQGTASRLVAALLGRARAAGVTRVYLLTTTAEAFFLRRGFARVDRAAVPAAIAATPEFQHLCPASAACLGRELAP